MADDMVFIGDAVARRACPRASRADVERLSRRMRFIRDHLRRRASLLHQTPTRRTVCSPSVISVCMLQVSVGSTDSPPAVAELLRSNHVVASRMPAEFVGAKRTPRKCHNALVKAAERALQALDVGKKFSSGTKTSSITISPVTETRKAEFAFYFRSAQPLHPAFENEASVTSRSSLARRP